MNKQEILDTVFQYSEKNLGKKFVAGKTYIPPSSPKLFPEDIKMLANCVLDFWYTEWKYSERFKEDLSKYCGNNQKVTLCNSGSSASLLAISAVCEHFKRDTKPLIVTCATTFPTTVTPIYLNKKIPHYIDIDPLTLSPNLEQLDFVLSQHRDGICGIFLAHNMGFPFNERAIRKIILKYDPNIWFVADCCDALGAKIDGNPVGLGADASTYSFFPAHHITTGEGGAVLSQSDELYSIIESISNWGRSCFCKPGQQNTCGNRFEREDRGELPYGWDHKYIFDRLGYNLKMTDLQAALGLSQLTHIDEFVWKRKSNYFNLLYGLHGFQDYLQFVVPPADMEFSPFGFPILVKEDAPFTPTELINHLESNKIGTRRLFAGNIIRQPGFMNLPYGREDLFGSDRVMNRMFWIGCQPSITDEMMDYMISIFVEFLEKYK